MKQLVFLAKTSASKGSCVVVDPVSVSHLMYEACMAAYWRHKEALTNAELITLSIVAISYAQDQPVDLGELHAARTLLKRLSGTADAPPGDWLPPSFPP